MLNPDTKKAISNIIKCLKEAENVLFITGAGISAESGLPTYRGISGLYTTGITEEGITIEQALYGQMFATCPEITWKYLLQIERACYQKNFHVAHSVIANMEKIKKRVWTLTQNVDGFHIQAGSKNVIEIHGNYHQLHCIKCSFSEYRESYTDLEIPPKCPTCKAPIRPEVVLFGEILPYKKLEVLERELTKGFDMIFSIGTSSVFPYISGPIFMASKSGIPTVEINPDKTCVSGLVTYKLNSLAGPTLQEIWNDLNQ